MFACSKDNQISMIRTEEPNVLGIFKGHNGNVLTLEPNSFNLITASSDFTVKNWDITTGDQIQTFKCDSLIRGISGQEKLYFCTDNSLNRECKVGFIDLRYKMVNTVFLSEVSFTNIFNKDDKLIVSDKNGNIYEYDLRNEKITNVKKIHHKEVTGLAPSQCGSFFVSSSSDFSFQIIDTRTFKIIKRFESDEPVNSAVIHPENEMIIAVGGEYARNVTTTYRKTYFDTYFYDVTTCDKIGFYSNHYGTINTVDVSPRGDFIASGGEDSLVSLIKLGDEIKAAPFTSLELKF
ncbi:EIF3I [Hepatospora eriocheir]|uniref:Serine-threonine kinase receptor-associated protein n=1 Tax=Hepatospora eriocheir TaxID=1081669 RepID=A0A1X0QCJ5_9MICR|nr:EIF3I [Hepatospora eriocheir]